MIAPNQLKLNANAIVDPLNLVNVVHRPKPIVIENLGHGLNRAPSDFLIRPRSDFEVIDEKKLSMYSYLVRRDLKNKQWMNKYHADQSLIHEEPTRDVDARPRTDVNVKKPIKKKSVMFSSSTELGRTPIHKSPTRSITSHTKPANDLVELRNCCDETIRSIEYLENKLSEFKLERLQVVFNDPVEEEKQKRIQLEQMKHFSRSMYNLQNQVGKLKSQFRAASGSSSTSIATTDDKKSTYKSLTPITRLIHTMRQVIKLNISFADLYPYRADNDATSEKLCFQFYKHLNACIDSFSNCIGNIAAHRLDTLVHEFNTQIVNSTKARLSDLLTNCDQYFKEFSQVEVDSKNLVKYLPGSNARDVVKGKKSNSVINVVRLPRKVPSADSNSKTSKTSVGNFSIVPAASVLTTNTIFDEKKNQFGVVQNPRIELSPARKTEKNVFKKKKIKTAVLYPTKSKKKDNNKSIIKSKITVNPSSVHNRAMKGPTNEQSTASRRYSSNDDLNLTIRSLSSEKPAFEHLSSPQMSRMRPKSADHSGQSPTRRKLIVRHYSDENLNEQTPTRSKMNSYHSDTMLTVSPQKFKQLIRNDGHSRDLRELRSRYDDELEHLKANYRPRPYGSNQSLTYTSDDDVYPSYPSRSSRSILKKTPNVKITPKTKNFLSRMDLIQNENEMIKRKYERLAYEHNQRERFSEITGTRRPYEECYTRAEDVKGIERDEDEIINLDKVYKPLRHPTLEQLKRVVDYSDKFADYNRLTSITRIGDSEFDDFDLFELLSKDIFKECLESVCDELEVINKEITANLMNGELNTSYSPGQFDRDRSSRSKFMKRLSTEIKSSMSKTPLANSQLDKNQSRDTNNHSTINSFYEESFISNET